MRRRSSRPASAAARGGSRPPPADGGRRWPRATRSSASRGVSTRRWRVTRWRSAPRTPAAAPGAVDRLDGSCWSGRRSGRKNLLLGVRRSRPAQPPRHGRFFGTSTAAASAGGGRPARRGWLSRGGRRNEAAQWGGPTLRVLRGTRRWALDPRLAALGPDILNPDFDPEEAVASIRRAGGDRQLGDALLDQRAGSPGSATSSRARGASRRGSTPGARVDEVNDIELRARGSRDQAADGKRAVGRGAPAAFDLPLWPAGPARSAGTPGLARTVRGTTTAGTYWCPRCQVSPPQEHAIIRSVPASRGRRWAIELLAARAAVRRALGRGAGALLACRGGARLPGRRPASSTRATTRDACYIVRAGSFRVTREHSDGRAITLATLGPGDIFGELAMLDGEVRSASVEALDDGELLALPAGDVRGLLARHPEITREAGRGAGPAPARRQRADLAPVLPDRAEPRRRGALPARRRGGAARRPRAG